LIGIVHHDVARGMPWSIEAFELLAVPWVLTLLALGVRWVAGARPY